MRFRQRWLLWGLAVGLLAVPTAGLARSAPPAAAAGPGAAAAIPVLAPAQSWADEPRQPFIHEPDRRLPEPYERREDRRKRCDERHEPCEDTPGHQRLSALIVALIIAALLVFCRKH